MKLIISFVLLCGLPALAQNSYEEQLCLSYGGEIKPLLLKMANPKVVKFCFWNYSGMEISTLYKSRLNSYGPEANRAYRATFNHDFMACGRHFGFQYSAQNATSEADTFRYQICTFNDGSMIENETLTDGVNSPWNRQLNTALGIF